MRERNPESRIHREMPRMPLFEQDSLAGMEVPMRGEPLVASQEAEKRPDNTATYKTNHLEQTLESSNRDGGGESHRSCPDKNSDSCGKVPPAGMNGAVADTGLRSSSDFRGAGLSVKPPRPSTKIKSGLSGNNLEAAQCETGAVRQDSASALDVAAAPDQAHARKTDGPNSHKAAESVTNLGRTKDAILACLRKLGPQTDEQIAEYFELWMAFPVSPSGLRTRRSWLVDHGFIRESGTGKTQAGRACSIWGIAERNTGEKA